MPAHLLAGQRRLPQFLAPARRPNHARSIQPLRRSANIRQPLRTFEDSSAQLPGWTVLCLRFPYFCLHSVSSFVLHQPWSSPPAEPDGHSSSLPKPALSAALLVGAPGFCNWTEVSFVQHRLTIAQQRFGCSFDLLLLERAFNLPSDFAQRKWLFSSGFEDQPSHRVREHFRDLARLQLGERLAVEWQSAEAQN